MAAGTTDALILQNFTTDNFGNVIGAPVQGVAYTNPSQVAPHTGAEATRPPACNGGDARAVFDVETGLFFFETIGGGDSYCIGVGGQGVTDPWKWNRIYWNGHSGDGARIAVLHSTVMLIGIGDVLLCDKTSLQNGTPSCSWQPTGPVTQTRPAVIKNGTSSVGYFIGLSSTFDPQHPGQLQVGYTDGTSLAPVYAGDLSAYVGTANIRTPYDVSPLAFQLRNAVYDVPRDVLWVAFNGPCLVSGVHMCMGAIEMILHPYPVFYALYYFDSPYNGLDASLGGMTVDHAGWPMFTWVASSPTLGDSMADGGFPPDQAGVHTLSAYGYYRITHYGQSGPFDRPDYVECDTIPGTNAVIAHGLHTVSYGPLGNPSFRFDSDIDTFNHCCNPQTGCPRSGCP